MSKSQILPQPLLALSLRGLLHPSPFAPGCQPVLCAFRDGPGSAPSPKPWPHPPPADPMRNRTLLGRTARPKRKRPPWEALSLPRKAALVTRAVPESGFSGSCRVLGCPGVRPLHERLCGGGRARSAHSGGLTRGRPAAPPVPARRRESLPAESARPPRAARRRRAPRGPRRMRGRRPLPRPPQEAAPRGSRRSEAALRARSKQVRLGAGSSRYSATPGGGQAEARPAPGSRSPARFRPRSRQRIPARRARPPAAWSDPPAPLTQKGVEPAGPSQSQGAPMEPGAGRQGRRGGREGCSRPASSR